MTNYEIYTIEDRYIIRNLSTTLDLILDVKKEVCGSVKWEDVENITIAPGTERELASIKEGHFKLLLTLGIEQKTIYIKALFTSIKNMIEDAEKVFCTSENDCKDCLDYINKSDMLLTTQSQIEIIKRLLNPEINPVMQETYTFTICYYQDLLNCQKDSNFINGKYTSPEKLISKLIGLDYIGLYLYYKINQGNPVFPELSYIDSLFNSKDLICCIEKNLNINFTEIQDKVDSANIISNPQ